MADLALARGDEGDVCEEVGGGGVALVVDVRQNGAQIHWGRHLPSRSCLVTLYFHNNDPSMQEIRTLILQLAWVGDARQNAAQNRCHLFCLYCYVTKRI